MIQEGEVIKNEKSLTITQDSAEALISRAIDKNVSVETMEKLLAMRRELKKEFAKEMFDESMAKFQGECPVIGKDKAVLNKDKTTTRYKYAPLDIIVKQAQEYLKNNGFSFSINTEVENSWVTAICKVTHKLGHSEISQFKIPIDPEAFMNQQQKFASALTFAKRYAFCNAFGILTGDEDDDGISAGNQSANTIRPAAKPPIKVYPKGQPAKPQAQKPAAPVKKTDSEFCSRCWNKFKQRTPITPAEAQYSEKIFGYKLCRECQGTAKKAKEANLVSPAGKKMAEARDKAREQAKFIAIDEKTAQYINDELLPQDPKDLTDIQRRLIDDCNKGGFKGRSYYGLDRGGVGR